MVRHGFCASLVSAEKTIMRRDFHDFAIVSPIGEPKFHAEWLKHIAPA